MTAQRNGHGEKMTRRREAAIAALLTAGTVPEAAEACGVSETTLFRWMQDAGFSEQYAAARREVLQAAVGELQIVAREAVGTLRRLMGCGTPSVECRAAVAVLETALRVGDLYDIDKRLDALEAALSPALPPAPRRAWNED
jgi:DNA-binding MurR/RpiR family transcriptional regulator